MAKRRPIAEGFVSGVSNSIRQFFARSEIAQASEIQRGGSPSVERAGLPFNLVNQFGYDSLAEHLRIDQDLQARYTDYEEMDEYPEISCISGHLRLPNLTVSGNIEEMVKGKTVAVKDLCEAVESGRVQRFFVYAIDHAAGRVVAAEAKGIRRTGEKVPVVRVVYEDYRRSGQWELVVTASHLCMLRDGSYRAAGDLRPGDRMMPCTFRLEKPGYLSIYEPLRKTSGGKAVYQTAHALVMRAMVGSPLSADEVAHHKDEDKANPHPMNLELRGKGEHAAGHVAGPGDAKRRKAIRQTVAGKWKDPSFKLQVAKAHQGSPKWLQREADGEHKHREATGTMSDAHRQAISDGRTIDLSPSVVEAAVRSSASFNDAARKVGVSWNTLMRRMDQFGFDRGMLGSLLGGPVEGQASYANHRVVSVEPAGVEDVYDIEVPGYHNFAVGDENGEGMVFVHNSAYDIYADDSAMPNEKGQSIWISSDNRAIESDLMEMLHKRIRIEDDIWGLERTIGKYGNAFGELLVGKEGLVGINFLPPPTVRRVEGPQGQLIGFIQDIRGEFNVGLEDFYKLAAERGADGERRRPPGELTVFEDWEVVHWRLRGKHLRSVYGHGVADGARWIWKRLSLLEDALLIYKLSRAPARYAFYVDIGEYDHERGLAYVNRVKNQFVKQKFVNPNTGKMDMRHSPLSHDEDFFIPSRGGKDSTRIEMLQGPDYAETDTVEYHRDKLVSAIKVPKAYLGYGGEASKSSLSSEDIRFARTVMRVQRETRTGVRKACRVHLVAKGADVDRYEYDAVMSVPSAILELARLEVLSATADLAQRTGEILSTKWVLTTLFKYSEEEAERLILEKDGDALRKAKVEAESQRLLALAQQAAQPPEEGGGEAPEAGAEPEPEAAPESIGRRGLRRADQIMLERRLGDMIKRQGDDTRRSLERKMDSRWRAEDKIAEAVRDPKIANRLRRIEGLLGDVRAAMRPVE